MSVLYVSEHEFVTPAGVLRLPPLHSYTVELQDDNDSEPRTCDPATQALRVYAEEDCTLWIGGKGMRLAAGIVEVFSITPARDLQIVVKAPE